MFLYEKNLLSVKHSRKAVRLQLLQAAKENPEKIVRLLVREKNARVRAEQLAEVDEITHILLNKRGWRHVLKKEGYHLARHREQFAMLFMDMDTLKKVNDTFGHDMGTRYIKIFAEVLHETMRPEDTLCHPQGDEFWAMMPKVTLHEVEEYRDKLVEKFQEYMEALKPDHEFYAAFKSFPHIGPSIGIAHKKWSEEEKEYLMEGSKSETIDKVYKAMGDVLKVADIDLYRVKKIRKLNAKSGRNALSNVKILTNSFRLLRFNSWFT
jgi:diguanylate cyclase (GGDEF)-like protein